MNELIFKSPAASEIVFEANNAPNIKFLTDVTSQKLYISWLGQGYEGTEAEFLEWLRVKGDTPYVGENENWWIAGLDTGKPSRGPVIFPLEIEQTFENFATKADIELSDMSLFLDNQLV